jgi:hypothetical protein
VGYRENMKNIIRTAAIVFSEESSAIKTITVQRKIIESLFIENDNKELNTDQIIDSLKNSLDMDFDNCEVNKIMSDSKHSHFEMRLDNKQDLFYFKLDNKRYMTLNDREEQNSIEPHIDNFIKNVYVGSISSGELNSILHKYFYELLNKNISTFQKISKPTNKPKDLFIDPNIFSVEEREAINEFLEWDDINKNKSIFALISYSLEYAIITNHYDSSAIFFNSIKNKEFFLDINVLYRAIGINGKNRQNRILTFLKKCQNSGQNFKISSYSNEEFKQTIKHHVRRLKKVPFQKINYSLFSKYSIDPSIYEYYHEWKVNRITYSFDLFTSHLLGQLDDFKNKFNVETVYKIPFDEKNKNDAQAIKTYQEDIAKVKGCGYEKSHYYDAINTYLIEKLRGSNKNSISDTKFFFVSTDQKLRNWDFKRNDFQPVALLPSHWMAILLKYYSRTTNDYKSFISFLKLKTNYPIVSSDNLQIILAGISEITEDFNKQESILDKIVEFKFDGILNGNNDSRDVFEGTINFVSKEFESEIESLNQKKSTSEFNFSFKQIRFKKDLLTEKELNRKELENQKIPIDKQAVKKFNFFKLKYSIIVIVYYILQVVLTISIGWDIMEPFIYFFGSLGIILSLLYPMIYGKNINPLVFFQSKKEELKNRTYSQFNFNVERINTLIEEENELKREIGQLEKVHDSE